LYQMAGRSHHKSDVMLGIITKTPAPFQQLIKAT
jgi:hypothetical protein